VLFGFVAVLTIHVDRSASFRRFCR